MGHIPLVGEIDRTIAPGDPALETPRLRGRMATAGVRDVLDPKRDLEGGRDADGRVRAGDRNGDRLSNGPLERPSEKPREP